MDPKRHDIKTGKTRGSLNLELALVIALLVLAGVTAVTALSSGISAKYIRGAETASLGTSVAPMTPVADWLAQSDGTFRDAVSGASATVTRAGNKTIFTGGRIVDVYPNRLAVAPWSDYKVGGTGYVAVIEEARTNYLVNSYGTTNTVGKWTAGWNFYGGIHGTPVYSLVQGVYGNTAQRIQYTGVAGDVGTEFLEALAPASANATFAATESAAGSCWVKGSKTGCTYYLVLYAYDSADNYIGQSVVSIAPTPAWQLITRAYPNLPASTDHLRFSVFGSSFHASDTLDITIDACQLEKGASATSYIPTVNAAVTRNADAVSIPVTGWNSAAGTFVGVGNVPPSTGINGVDHFSFVTAYFTGYPNQLSLHDDYGGFMRMQETYDYTWAGSSILVGQHTAAGTWTSGSPLGLYQDGVAGSVSGAQSAYTTISSAQIGTSAWGYANAPIQRVTIYNRVLSGAEVTSLNELVNGP